MREELKAALNALNLKENEKNITVALSGGKDSVALLYGLLELKEEFALNIYAAHFNHLLRGDESFRDEEFVYNLCEKLGVPLVIESGDVKAFAEEQKIGIEDAARRLRYEFLERVNKGVVATAHTASDNLETILLHITRGSGLDGLCGIPQKRDIFIRPLLSVTSEQTENYCKENGYDFVIDSTNFAPFCSRNFLRLNVVPLLKRLNPAIESAVTRLVGSVNNDKDYIDKNAAEIYKTHKKDNTLLLNDADNLHPAIVSRLVILYLKENNVDANSLRVKQILSSIKCSDTKISVGKDKFVYIKGGVISVTPFCEKIKQFKVNIEEKNVDFLYNGKKFNKLLLKNSIDCDKIDGILTVRTKKEGDKLTLADRGVTKTLKKLFNEDGLSQETRQTLPVIADSKGVVWVQNYGVDKNYCPNEFTKKVYYVNCKETEE